MNKQYNRSAPISINSRFQVMKHLKEDKNHKFNMYMIHEIVNTICFGELTYHECRYFLVLAGTKAHYDISQPFMGARTLIDDDKQYKARRGLVKKGFIIYKQMEDITILYADILTKYGRKYWSRMYPNVPESELDYLIQVYRQYEYTLRFTKPDGTEIVHGSYEAHKRVYRKKGGSLKGGINKDILNRDNRTVQVLAAGKTLEGTVTKGTAATEIVCNDQDDSPELGHAGQLGADAIQDQQDSPSQSQRPALSGNSETQDATETESDSITICDLEDQDRASQSNGPTPIYRAAPSPEDEEYTPRDNLAYARQRREELLSITVGRRCYGPDDDLPTNIDPDLVKCPIDRRPELWLHNVRRRRGIFNDQHDQERQRFGRTTPAFIYWQTATEWIDACGAWQTWIPA